MADYGDDWRQHCRATPDWDGRYRLADIIPLAGSVDRCEPLVLLYFIGAGDFIKVGKTTRERLIGRVLAMQTGCPHELQVLATMECGRSFERVIHRRLAADHHRAEWFRRSERMEALVTEVNAAALPHPNGTDACGKEAA